MSISAAGLPCASRRFLRSLACAALLIAVFAGEVSVAGVYTDDLTKCLVKSTDAKDRILLVQWMFSALALHPAVQPLVSVKPEERTSVTGKAATVFSRLLTENCRKETIEGIRYEGNTAIATSFQVLGQVASRDLMSDSNVSKGMGELGTSLEDNNALKSLLRDAGIGDKK